MSEQFMICIKKQKIETANKVEVMNPGHPLQLIFNIRLHLPKSVDLNICLLPGDIVQLSTRDGVMAINSDDFFVLIEAITQGCTARNKALLVEIFIAEGEKGIVITKTGSSRLMLPFIQDSMLKAVKVINTIINFRRHIDKDAVKQDIEAVVVYSLFNFRLRMNFPHNQVCPACANGNNDRHFCANEVIGHKVLPQSRFRAAEDVVTFEAHTTPGANIIPVEDQMNKLYFIFNIQEQYTYDDLQIFERKVKEICLLRDVKKLTQLIETSHLQYIYDRYFHRDVELVALDTYPSKITSTEFVN